MTRMWAVRPEVQDATARAEGMLARLKQSEYLDADEHARRVYNDIDLSLGDTDDSILEILLRWESVEGADRLCWRAS